jgi:hypothetical protein
MRPIRYPVRCIIIDADGMSLSDGDFSAIAKTPDESKPHIGKHGLAEEITPWDVKITLDDGNIIHGYECWWIPEDEEANLS